VFGGTMVSLKDAISVFGMSNDDGEFLSSTTLVNAHIVDAALIHHGGFYMKWPARQSHGLNNDFA
jgi:hypothetical protein